jgi:hypothetical protein
MKVRCGNNITKFKSSKTGLLVENGPTAPYVYNYGNISRVFSTDDGIVITYCNKDIVILQQVDKSTGKITSRKDYVEAFDYIQNNWLSYYDLQSIFELRAVN